MFMYMPKRVELMYIRIKVYLCLHNTNILKTLSLNKNNILHSDSK